MKRLFLIAASVFLFSVQNSFAQYVLFIGKKSKTSSYREPEIQGTLCIYDYNHECRHVENEGEMLFVGFTDYSRNGVFQLGYQLDKYGFFAKHFNSKDIILTEIYSEPGIKISLKGRRNACGVSVNDNKVSSFFHLRNDEGVSVNTLDMNVPKSYLGKSVVFGIKNYYCKDELDEYKKSFINNSIAAFKGQNKKAKARKLKYEIEDIMFALSETKKKELNFLVNDLKELIQPQNDITESSLAQIIQKTNKELREKCVKTRTASQSVRVYFNE